MVPSGAAAGLVLIQVFLGAYAVVRALPPAVTVAHVAMGAALVATLVGVAAASHHLSAADSLTRESKAERVLAVKHRSTVLDVRP